MAEALREAISTQRAPWGKYELRLARRGSRNRCHRPKPRPYLTRIPPKITGDSRRIDSVAEAETPVPHGSPTPALPTLNRRPSPGRRSLTIVRNGLALWQRGLPTFVCPAREYRSQNVGETVYQRKQGLTAAAPKAPP
jgi:hypothetical protein